MIDDSINYEYILRYIHDVLPKQEGLIAELERFAKEHEVPISQPETIKMLEVLIKLGGRKNILEVGSAIGYSAVRMAMANPEAEIQTIEINHDAAEYAKSTFKRAGLSDRIRLTEGDANVILPQFAADGMKFDMIFVDAAKAQYLNFFEPCMNMLVCGGLLVSDNILYKGMTATDELVLHRKRTIVKRLRVYIDMLCSHPQLDTAVLPVGDGVALSYRSV